MIKNYFKTAWRNLWKNKFYSAINISGLAIGLAVGIMILLWVQDESSYDSFHQNANTIYRINSHLGTGTNRQVWANSPAPLAIYSKQEIPEVTNAVRIKDDYDNSLFSFKDKKFVESKLAYIDSNFFSMFDFKLLKGNPVAPFPDINSVILTSSTARKYFGSDDPIGKIMVADNKDNFVVNGVIEDFPQNSTVQYDMFFPMSLYAKRFAGNGNWKTIDEDVGNFMYSVFVQLQPGASPESIGKKITASYWKHRSDENPNSLFYTLQSLKSLHLIQADGSNGAMQIVKIFVVVAILILLIACINYVNLSTARSMLRSKEVSVRKIIGAARSQLFIQFIIESALLFLFASLLAFFIIYLLLPLYNNLSEKQLVFSLRNTNVWIVVGLAITGTLALGSIYPALLLSSFKPTQALKGKLSLGIGTASFRKALVITQFVFSVCLIIATVVISKQLKYIRNKDLGFNKEYVFSFSLKKELHDHTEAARNELLKQLGVLGVAFSDNSIAGVNNTTGDTQWEGKEENSSFLIHTNCIDEHFIPLLKLQLVQGSNFTGSKADSAHFILNETAVKEAGIENPVGKNFTLWDKKGTIIGVVKDFNYASLKEKVEPSIFYFEPPNWRMFVKTTGNDASKAIAAATAIWKKYNPEYPFDYSFLDDDFGKMYTTEQRTSKLFNVFAVIAIAISCLGLFGLATYTAQVKTKEIGIRKVLGATVTNITGLLAKEFILLVLIAFTIASPVAYWAMHNWLQNYPYRTDIEWWVFAIVGLLSVMIAIATVSLQAIKAALANPVKSLRSE